MRSSRARAPPVNERTGRCQWSGNAVKRAAGLVDGPPVTVREKVDSIRDLAADETVRALTACDLLQRPEVAFGPWGTGRSGSGQSGPVRPNGPSSSRRARIESASARVSSSTSGAPYGRGRTLASVRIRLRRDTGPVPSRCGTCHGAFDVLIRRNERWGLSRRSYEGALVVLDRTSREGWVSRWTEIGGMKRSWRCESSGEVTTTVTGRMPVTGWQASPRGRRPSGHCWTSYSTPVTPSSPG
ncbi:DUF6192 family protein [Streptomyces iconiensis]|uniref:DUF6192 family protein n=1 Tax=Streptomyces iconiensis TaxID=1384038 RepID=UPI003D2F8511